MLSPSALERAAGSPPSSCRLDQVSDVVVGEILTGGAGGDTGEECGAFDAAFDEGGHGCTRCGQAQWLSFGAEHIDLVVDPTSSHVCESFLLRCIDRCRFRADQQARATAVVYCTSLWVAFSKWR